MDEFTIPVEDLQSVLDQTRDQWESLDGNIFLAGGTGFIGTWLMETFLYARQEIGFHYSIIVLTRNMRAAWDRHYRIASCDGIAWAQGDVRDPITSRINYNYTINAACDSVGRQDDIMPLGTWRTIVNGTESLLNHANKSGRPKRFLLVSSHGTQQADPSSADSVYANAKLAAESLCSIYRREFNIQTAVVRPYAIVGPHLPLDAHYAIGNFIQDGMNGHPILISGDGTGVRCYIYAADLVTLMWKILLGECTGTHFPQHSLPLTIEELAHLVADQFSPRPCVFVHGKPSTKNDWVYDSKLIQAVQKTIKWNTRERATA